MSEDNLSDQEVFEYDSDGSMICDFSYSDLPDSDASFDSGEMSPIIPIPKRRRYLS